MAPTSPRKLGGEDSGRQDVYIHRIPFLIEKAEVPYEHASQLQAYRLGCF
jgi:hypothetical protein